MDIIIRNDKRLHEIQSEFQKRFPYLKIEFFHPKPAPHDYSAKDIINPSNKIEEVAKIADSPILHITGLMAVSELEMHFREMLGIHVEVFRKSGKVWLKTSATDHWTLDEQNKEAQESESGNENKPEHEDYHEQE